MCSNCADDYENPLDGDLPEPTEEQDELQRKLAETHKRIRQTSDTAAIRRVNQQTKALLNRMGLERLL